MSQHGQVVFLLLILIAFFAFAGFVIKNPPDEATVSQPESSERGETTAPADQNAENPPAGEPEEYEEPEDTQIPSSERTGSVYISNISRSYGDRPMRITLKSNLNEGETVNIDDWEIKGNDGRVFIPEAVNFYQIPGPNDSGDIVLEPGHTVTIYLGIKSPLSKNFRLNKCTGYLNENYDFLYSLPNECPLPEKDDYKHLSGECQNYIRQMGRCERPDPNVTNSFLGEQGNECREFVNEFFNIGNCYRYFKGDSDFLKKEWRVWIDRENVFDPQHDWLKILNKGGQIIDDYTY